MGIGLFYTVSLMFIQVTIAHYELTVTVEGCSPSLEFCVTQGNRTLLSFNIKLLNKLPFDMKGKQVAIENWLFCMQHHT